MRTRCLALLAVAVVILAACSSGSSDTSTAKTTPGGEESAPAAARGSEGCGTAAPVTPGEEKVATDSSGTERWYFRHVPESYTGTEPVPVVLDLHGYAEGATVHQLMSNLGVFGEDKGFITITPQGTGPVPRWDTALDSPDVAFVGDLLDEVESTLCVDRKRVFVTGLSNGAFMTSAVACKYADRVAAAAPVAGIREIDGCKPTRPVPVIAFHGTNDTFVAYDGGLGSSVAGLPSPDGSGKRIGDGVVDPDAPKGPTIADITAAWAKRNGCKTAPAEEQVASDVTLITFACPKGAEAELYRVDGGGHSWPGSAFSEQVASVIGPTTKSISANELMWEFFQAHPRSGS